MSSDSFGPLVLAPASPRDDDLAEYGPITTTDPFPQCCYVMHDEAGAVIGTQQSNTPPRLRHVAVAGPNELAGIHHRTHRVENGRVVEMSDAEKKIAAAPTAFEVRAMIYGELAASDITQVPDYPIAAPLRAAWASYRQALRDLSKHHTDHLDMIRHWPKRPDGTDAIAALRTRIPI